MKSPTWKLAKSHLPHWKQSLTLAKQVSRQTLMVNFFCRKHLFQHIEQTWAAARLENFASHQRSYLVSHCVLWLLAHSTAACPHPDIWGIWELHAQTAEALMLLSSSGHWHHDYKFVTAAFWLLAVQAWQSQSPCLIIKTANLWLGEVCGPISGLQLCKVTLTFSPIF